MRERLMLLDSASLYFRAYHGLPDSLTAADGTPVNAVRGFLDALAHLVSTRSPRRLVACWDEDWRPAFRVAAIPSYKAHRVADPLTGAEATPPLLDAQVPMIVDLLCAFGIARVGAPGYEADDVIATLTARAVSAGGHDVEVVTGDRDLFQVVDDAAGVRVLYIGRGVRNLETVDQAWLSRKYGVPSGAAYADLAVLRGDPSDGLPGIPGVGERTAAGLLARYGSLEGLLTALDGNDARLSGATRRRLTENRGYLDVAPAVVRVVADAPVPAVDDALPVTPADAERLVDLTAAWGVASSVERVLRALARS